MKYLIVLFSDFPYGTALGRRYHLLAKGIAKCGHSVTVLAGNQKEGGSIANSKDGLDVIGIERGGESFLSKVTNRLKSLIAFYKVVKSSDLDVCIFVYPDLDRLPFLVLAKLFKKKIVCTYDDERIVECKSLFQVYLYIRGELADYILPKVSDVLLPTSKHLKSHYDRCVPSVPSTIFPPVVDVGMFKESQKFREKFRQENRINDAVLLAYLGTFWHVEGLATLIAAFRKVVSAGINAKLVIAGKAHAGFPADNVEHLVREHDLSNRVILPGWLDNAGVLEVMSAADIFVLPKIDHPANRAGMPAKLAEYLAFGKPLICSSVGDIPDYIRSSIDAIIVKPGDCLQLSDAICRLSQDAPLRKELGEAARLAALTFDYNVVSRRIADFIAEQVS